VRLQAESEFETTNLRRFECTDLHLLSSHRVDVRLTLVADVSICASVDFDPFTNSEYRIAPILALAANILVCASINFDFFTDTDKQGYGDLCPSFDDRGFAPTSGCIALHPRIGIGDY
jgi:hypothetical protein